MSEAASSRSVSSRRAACEIITGRKRKKNAPVERRTRARERGAFVGDEAVRGTARLGIRALSKPRAYFYPTRTHTYMYNRRPHHPGPQLKPLLTMTNTVCACVSDSVCVAKSGAADLYTTVLPV